MQEAEEHVGDDGGHHEDIDDAEHADEEVHGAVQTLHAADHAHKQRVSQQCQQVGNRKRQRQQPAVFLQLGETSEHKGAVAEVPAQRCLQHAAGFT